MSERGAGDPPLHDTIMAPTEASPSGSPEAVSSLAPLAELAPASFADRYVPGPMIGRGGMGEVRAHRDRRIGRDVAVKVLRAHLSDPASTARFVHEARVQGQLEHPAVVPVYDLGAGPGGEPCFTMKRVHGETLAAVLDRTRAAGGSDPVARRRLLSAFARVCQAVEYAHVRAVVHRDLKPANIVLGALGEVYVLDWGLARIVGEGVAAPKDGPAHEPVEALADSTPATEHGVVMGTPGYMAPEQLRGQTVDRTADVYALGSILFEVLTLEPLHPRTEAVASTLSGADARASARVPAAETPPELEALCVAATAADPGERPSAGDLAEAVERFLAGDRDLERRRELAAEHAQAARDALERATPGGELEARKEAMREAGQALALDPENREAALTMAALVTDPPAETPPEVLAEIERTDLEVSRAEARAAMLGTLGLVAIPPLLLWMGVREWWSFGALVAAIAVQALATLVYLRSKWARPIWLLATIPTFAVMIVLAGRLAGPLFIAPAVAGIYAVGYLMHRNRFLWQVAMATAVVVTMTPLALELFGVVTPGYAFADGALVILPRGFEFSPAATITCFGLVALFVVAMPSLLLYRVVVRSRELERRLHLQAWHLRQLAPQIKCPTGSAAR